MPVRVRLGQHEAAVTGPGGAFVFDLSRGTYTISSAGGAEAGAGATSGVVLAGGEAHALSGAYARTPESAEVSDAVGRGMALKVSCEPEGAGPRQILTAACYEDVPGVFLSLACEGPRGRELRVDSLEVLAVRSPKGARVTGLPGPAGVRFHHTGSHMHASPFVDLARPPRELREWAESSSTELMGCFADPHQARAGLLVGFVTAARMPVRVRFGLEPGGEGWDEIVALCECESRPLREGAVVRSERLYVTAGEAPLEAMERYADLLARSMNARLLRSGGTFDKLSAAVLSTSKGGGERGRRSTGSRRPEPVEGRRPPELPTGWCSWYYFFAGVTQEDILSNLRYLAERRGRYPVRDVQIDDGYQRHWGDWLKTSGRFPGGMAALADEIKTLGFVPGIWVAPFVASTVSDIARDHPGWLVRDAGGEPVSPGGWGAEQPWHVLDGTHPEVQEHLENLFRVITSEWGYGYVKLDAMNRGAPGAAVFHDPRATRVEAYRRGFEAIRRGCGEDVFILGCNALFGPSVGIIDGCRVSPDVGPSWGGAGRSLRSSIRRWFFHGRTWWNDPDCLVVRGPERKKRRGPDGEPTGEEVDRPGLTLDEARTLTAGVGLLGGMMLFSDDMPSLAPERAALHDLLFPLNTRSARPLDLFENDPPSILDLRVEKPWESWHVVAVVNWLDGPAPHALDLDRLGVEAAPARYHVFELFEERYLGCAKGEVELGTVPPHGTRVLAVRKALDRPQLLSTTFHLTQGGEDLSRCEWSEGERKLALEFAVIRKRTGRVYVHVPGGAGEPELSGTAKVLSSRLDGEVLRIELEAAPGATFEVAFR